MSTSNPVLRIAVLLSLLVGLLAPAARAQIWQGPASLEIKAEGKGASVAGASVELLYLALDPPAGPPPVQLDSRGRAVVGGLAEGMWRVSVSREGFMTYQAEVDVRRDEKPELVATFQQNVPGAVHMMQVKMTRGRPSGSSALPPPPRIAERPAPRPVEPPRASVPEPVPAPAPVTPPREQPEIPAPAPQAPPETVPQATLPPPVERPVPSAPAPSVPAPAPTPTPTPSPTPAPPVRVPPPPSAPPPQAAPPQPAPPAPSVPSSGSVLHRSHADRTCYECKPGEASLSVERVVSSGVGCGSVGRDLLAHSGDQAGLPEGCAVLRLTLPPGSRYTGYRYEIQERSGSIDCLAGRDCPGGGRWPVDPALVRSASGTTVSAAFENLGTGNERRAILTAYFTER